MDDDALEEKIDHCLSASNRNSKIIARKMYDYCANVEA